MANIIQDIIDGKVTDKEIWESNARVVLKTAKAVANDKHDPEGCKKKDCVHGNEKLVQRLIGHAATLTEEANQL